MKKYTIIGGVNGSGKSSFTGAIKSEMKDLGIIIDVDKITASMGGNQVEGGKAALKKIKDCLEKGVCFTQESTLSGNFLQKTAKQAQDLDYYIRLYYIGLDSVDECLERIANRVRKGGHNIAEEDVIRRFSERWKAVSVLLPYCNEAAFFDNDNGFREVARYQSGELQIISEDPPAWVRELQAYLHDQQF